MFPTILKCSDKWLNCDLYELGKSIFKVDDTTVIK